MFVISTRWCIFLRIYKEKKYRNPNNSISDVPKRMSSMNSSHSKRWKIRFVLSAYPRICKGLRKLDIFIETKFMDQSPVSYAHVYCDLKLNFIDMGWNEKFKKKIALHYIDWKNNICSENDRKFNKNTLEITFFQTLYDSKFLKVLLGFF